MLAKLWKKVLLAICIIAILFNLTSKLVRRYSLDTQLNSVVGGESLSEIFNTDKEKKNKNSQKENSSKNKNQNNKSKNSDENEEDYNSEYDDEYNDIDNSDSRNNEENYYEENREEDQYEEEQNNVDVDVQFDPTNDFDSFEEIFQMLFE